MGLICSMGKRCNLERKKQFRSLALGPQYLSV